MGRKTFSFLKYYVSKFAEKQRNVWSIIYTQFMPNVSIRNSAANDSLEDFLTRNQTSNRKKLLFESVGSKSVWAGGRGSVQSF